MAKAENKRDHVVIVDVSHQGAKALDLVRDNVLVE